MLRALVYPIVILLFGACAWAQLADPIPAPIQQGTVTIELQPIAAGLVAPNYLTHAGDGADRLFVVDQAGQIRLIKNGALQTIPFLDVSSRLVDLGFFGTHDANDFDERGLLGLAFHPGFSDLNSAGYRKLYTYSSEPGADFTFPGGPDHQSVIAEWQVSAGNADIVDLASRRELLRIDQPQFNHNGGMLAFGADDYLYVALGDGGAGDDQGPGGATTGHGPDGNGQNINTLHGSILRIDPLDPSLTTGSPNAISGNGKYRLPSDNPFASAAGADEIYAYGLRNPFRFSFDKPTGRLIVADVGQNAIEEVDIVVNGGNYGWRIKEGTFLFDPNGSGSGFVSADSPGNPIDMIDPVVQYDHDEGLSAIGGFVYRGSELPELAGKYVFGDFSRGFFSPQGRLFYADLDTGEINELILGLDDRELGLFVKGFGEDADGELYLLAGTNLGPFGDFGQVLKIVPAAVPEPTSLVLLIGAGALLSRRPQRRVGLGPPCDHAHHRGGPGPALRKNELFNATARQSDCKSLP